MLRPHHPEIKLEVAAEGFEYGLGVYFGGEMLPSPDADGSDGERYLRNGLVYNPEVEMPDELGPAGILFFESSDDWLVANGGTGELFRFSGLGNKAEEPLSVIPDIIDMTVTPGDRVYATAAQKLIEIDPVAGVELRTVADGFNFLSCLVYDKQTGKLIVSDEMAFQQFLIDPETGEKELIADAPEILNGPDGLVLSGDGRIFVGTYMGQRLLEVTREGEVTELGFFPGVPDGIAVGAAGSPLEGSIICNLRDGSVVAYDLESRESTILATGGSPGEVLSVAPDGSLFVTNFDFVYRMTPNWFEPQPYRVLP